MVDETTAALWRNSVDPQVWLHLHHYCAGLIWLDRARREATSSQRAFALDQALSEAGYTFARIPPQDAMAPLVGAVLVAALTESGKKDQALEMMNQMIDNQPTREHPYVLAAIELQRSGNTTDALTVLARGEAAVASPSAEFFYNYGLISLQAGLHDDAVRYAKLAYSMGYPLRGLRDKLERLGLW